MRIPTRLLVLVSSLLLACGASQGPTAEPTASLPETAPTSAAPSTPTAEEASPPLPDGPPPSDPTFDFSKVDAVDEKLFKKGPCGGFEKRAAGKDGVPLLDDRFTIKAFNGLENNPRGGQDIMAAPEPTEEETRLFATEGDKKFVVFVQEMFRRPGANFVEDIQKRDPDAKHSTVGKLKIAGLDALVLVPKTLEASGNRVGVLAVYLVTPENAVVRVSFAVSPDVVAQGAGCTNLARTLANTFALGKRKLDLQAGARTLDAGVTINVPAGFAAYPQRGPDFVVWHVLEVSTFDAPEGGLHIYFGHHPQSPTATKEVSANLFGKPTKWLEETDQRGRLRETIERVPGQADLFAHVIIEAQTGRLFDAFTAMAASMKK